MSAIRTYLEEKAALPEKEWLHRDPRETHPDILERVRDAEAGGLHYDDDVESYVNASAGDLPAHRRHDAPGRDRLVTQLGHEVYIARGCLTDEASSEALAALLADGFGPLEEDALEDGARYLVRFGTLYCGQTVPAYGEAREVRARRDGGRVLLMPKGARTRGYLVTGPALVRAVTS